MRIRYWAICSHVDDDGLESWLIEGVNDQGVVFRITASDYHHACEVEDALSGINGFEVVMPERNREGTA